MTRPVRSIGSEDGREEDGATVLPLKSRGEKGGGGGDPPQLHVLSPQDILPGATWSS